MTENAAKLVVIATFAEESPDKATLPFVLGNAALAMDVEASIILQGTGVYLALRGYPDHVHAAGFPPLTELQELFQEAGGKIMVCSPCLQARKIAPEDLIPGAAVIAGATLVSEILSATSSVTY